MKFIDKEVSVIHKVESDGDCRKASTYRMTQYRVFKIPVHTKVELLRKEDIK